MHQHAHATGAEARRGRCTHVEPLERGLMVRAGARCAFAPRSGVAAIAAPPPVTVPTRITAVDGGGGGGNCEQAGMPAATLLGRVAAHRLPMRSGQLDFLCSMLQTLLAVSADAQWQSRRGAAALMTTIRNGDS